MLQSRASTGPALLWYKEVRALSKLLSGEQGLICPCCRAELAEKQVQLLEREKELLDKDQTVSTLREEVCPFCNASSKVLQTCQ